MIAFWVCDYNCLWRLDTQEIVPLILDIGYDPPAIINSSHTNQIFVPRDNTMEIWEVSMTGSNMMFETEPLSTQFITSICPLHDGRRLLVGTVDGTVRMQNLESACHSGYRCTKNYCILALRKDGGYKIMAVCLH